jgi:hypothetical protein
MELIRRYATRGKDELVYDPRRKHGPLALKRSVEYFGFELENELETVDEFPPALANPARHLLAESMARGEARHFAVKKNRDAIEAVREAYKRSGGETTRLGFPELTALYESQLAGVNSFDEFKSARLDINRDALVPREARELLDRLPDQVTIRDREVEIDYDIEERHGKRLGVARLRLPEKIARTLTEEEIPRLDRPVRFVVLRGQRGAVRSDSLEDLQERLAQPWSPDEIEETADDRTTQSSAEREVRQIASEFRRHRQSGDRPHHKGGKSNRGPRGRSDFRKRRRGR